MFKEESFHCALRPVVHGIRKHLHGNGVDAQEVTDEHDSFDALKTQCQTSVRHSAKLLQTQCQSNLTALCRRVMCFVTLLKTQCQTANNPVPKC